MNTFSLRFTNISNPLWSHRDNTTYSQLQSSSPVGLLYLPAFNVTLSTDGQDWTRALKDLSALRNKPFYRDAEDRSVEFSITFDFGCSDLPCQLKLDFIAKAKLCLIGSV